MFNWFYDKIGNQIKSNCVSNMECFKVKFNLRIESKENLKFVKQLHSGTFLI